MESVLVLSPMGYPPYSARDLSQTLEPIGASQNLRRTVNGTLVNLGAEQFQKFASTITGNDQQAPAIDGVWPGALVEVDCIVELAVRAETPTEPPTGSSTDNPFGFSRTPVPGSTRLENGFYFYRPRLTMRVVAWRRNDPEYRAEKGWALELEEV